MLSETGFESVYLKEIDLIPVKSRRWSEDPFLKDQGPEKGFGSPEGQLAIVLSETGFAHKGCDRKAFWVSVVLVGEACARAEMSKSLAKWGSKRSWRCLFA